MGKKKTNIVAENSLLPECRRQKQDKRERAKKVLLDSEKRLRSLVDSMDDLIFVIGMNGTFKAYYQPLQRSKLHSAPDDLIGKHYREVFPPDSWRLFQSAIKKIEKSGNAQQIEYSADANGVKSWYEARISPVKDEAGDSTEFIVVARDITRRKNSRMQLALLDGAITSSINSTAILDLNGNIRNVNPSFLKMFGFDKPEEVVKKNISVFVKDKDSRLSCNLTSCLLPGESDTQVEAIAIRKGGAQFYVEMRVYPVLNAEKQVIGITASLINVTERRRAEERLQKSEATFRELAESITDVFLAMDQDLRCTYWNKPCEKLSGISAQDALGKKIYDLLPVTEIRNEKIVEMYRQVLKSKQASSLVAQYTLQGNNYIFEINAYPTQNGLSVFSKDITRQQQLEKTLKRSDQQIRELMLASIRAHEEVGRWLAFEVHDSIAQSLISIHQQLQTLKATVSSKSTDSKYIESALTYTKQAISETRTIMNNLHPFESEEFRLDGIMAQELLVFQQDTGCKTLLDINSPVNPLPKNVEMNLYRIFHEALANIRRHAAGVRNVVASLRFLGGSMILHVHDDGEGFNVEKAQSKRQVGGLHSMRWRAEIIGGTLVVTSSPAHGTNVGVFIPLWWESAQPSAQD